MRPEDVTPNLLVDAFGDEAYEQALSLSQRWLLRSVVAEIAGRVDDSTLLSTTEVRTLSEALSVAELSALRLLDVSEANGHGKLITRFRKLCVDAFYLQRSLPSPEASLEMRKSLLRLASFAILGDRSADARRWLREHSLPTREEEPTWPVRVFEAVSEAFLRVIRKDGWEDLHAVASAIAELRTLQEAHEGEYLGATGGDAHAAALELVALYHLAKAVEALGTYSGSGQPKNIISELKFHYLRAIRGASAAGLMELEILLRWMRASSIALAQNSVWWLLRSFNSRISEHVRNLASEDAPKPLLELLPPQRRAILEDGLLDPAHRAVVVQMPTSSGKTLLAEFRILQARNSFPEAWIAYLVPTRALVNQIAHRLRRDLGPLGLKIESAAPALEIDVFEEEWLSASEEADVVVTTPEKLDLLIRGGSRGTSVRPLGLVILDEAHNLGEGERGVRAELLLSNLNQEFPDAQFLLLTPFVPNGDELAEWLDPQRSKAITVLAAEWQPNDRAIGIAYPEGAGRDWGVHFRTVHTIPASVDVAEDVELSDRRPPLDMPISKGRAKARVAAATAKLLSKRRNSSCVVLADSPATAWRIADDIAQDRTQTDDVSKRIRLVQRYVQAEVSAEFELIGLLGKRIGVHHAGLSPEVRFLVEWLTDEGELDVLVSTTTLAQGVNFPVSAIVLATHYLYQPLAGKQPMTPAAFQNLAGRAGRLFQDTLGIVAFASSDRDAPDIEAFIGQQAGELASALEQMVIDIVDRGWDLNLTTLVKSDPRWASFAQYLAHAYRLGEGQQSFVADSEKILRATWGYRRLESSRPAAAELLVDATREYAVTLDRMGTGILSLVDSTGFSGETIMDILERRELIPTSLPEWSPSQLFAGSSEALQNLFGLLLNVRELELQSPGGQERQRLAQLVTDWVNGKSLEDLAKSYYSDDDSSLMTALTRCCQDLFRSISTNGAWGLGALQTIARIELESLSPDERDRVRSLPAMIFYGVSSVPAVLMRTLAVPRSAAEGAGNRFTEQDPGGEETTVGRARGWLESLSAEEWAEFRPSASPLSGDDYRRLWRVLNGMEIEAQ